MLLSRAINLPGTAEVRHMLDPGLGNYVRPDSLDFRDRIFQPTLVEVPSEIRPEDYRKVGVPILNQIGRPSAGRAGVRKRLLASAAGAAPHSTAWACTGFALSTLVHYLLRRRSVMPDTSEVSPAMLFEMARRYDDYTGDHYLGSSARGAMKGWHLHGVCTRDLWPFGQDRLDRQLTARRARDAASRPLGAYFRVNHKDLAAIHCALAEVGVLYAVANVHRGWLQAGKDGTIAPSPKILGSHAVAIVAYNRRGFWIQNSWSAEWGARGLGFLSYDDWLENGLDVWAARLGVPMLLREPSSAARITASASASNRRQVVSQLRPHLVRIHNDGPLQSNDVYGTSAEDLDTIFTEEFPHATKGWKKKRLLLYADGGLVSASAAVQRGVADYRASLLGQEVYPLAFVWRTGFWDTIGAVLRRTLSLRRPDSALDSDVDFLLDRLNDALEPQARQEGGKLHWDEMKRTARQATALAEGGVRLTLDRVTRLVKGDPSVEVHVVAHGAGAILLAPALQLLTSKGRITSGPMKGRNGKDVSVRSCTLWAPACTTALFDATYLKAIQRRRIRRFRLITLTKQAEATDNVAGIYRKSLLHLISSALEDQPRVPGDSEGADIMGMETFAENHAAFRQLLRRKSSVDWITSPATMAANQFGAIPPAARHHGDFDDDNGTLVAALSVILGESAKDVNLSIHRSASSSRAFRLSL